MNPYYQILGLDPGASQPEIKKAYFRMIRKHSPESDPEGFQKIREAYEQLKNAPSESGQPAFAPLSGPSAEKLMEQLKTYRSAKDLIKYRDTCEEAWRRFPDDLPFLYLLAVAQRQCGNTGKAVKNAELLVSREPENKWFQKELAVSYIKRGFTNKAYCACQRAYELGCRDMDFILTYAYLLEDRTEYHTGVLILLEIVRQEKKWTKYEIPDLVEAFNSLFDMNYHGRESFLSEILERLAYFLEQYSVYLKEYIPSLSMLMANTCVYAKPASEEYQQVLHIFEIMRSACSSAEDKELLDLSLHRYDYYLILEDTRIKDTMERYLEIFFSLDEADSTYQKFAILDTQLCMLEERDDILCQADIIRQDYPRLYKYIEDFMEKLRSAGSIAYLKSSLQKTYRRLEPLFFSGYYYMYYPQEKKNAEGTLLTDGFEPYVRGTKKIGRNDPCPCGSGKKYKHCCMNK